MQNKNYELVKRTRKRIKNIVKISDDLYQLMELKKRMHRRNKKSRWYSYEIRPHVVCVAAPQFIGI